MRVARRHTLGWIDQIGIGGTELRVEHHVVGVIICVGGIISRAVLIIGTDQTVETVIAIDPGATHIR